MPSTSAEKKPVIAVVTATGAQGRSVCASFHNSGRWHVRALTRDPSGPVAHEYVRQGIEVVQANFESKEDLLRAFEGAWAVFGVTIPPWHQAYGNSMPEYEQGVLQADAAKEAGVKFILWSTLPYVGPDFMGLGGVELYDSKARTNDYIKSIGVPSVFVSTPVFADNVMAWPLVKWSDDGQSLEFWHYVLDPEKPVTWIWVERDLGPAMLELANSFWEIEQSGKVLESHPMNHTVQPCGSWRGTYGDIVRTIAELTGIPVKHTVLPNVDHRWHPDLTKAFVYQNTHGLYPEHEFPSPAFIQLGTTFHTLEDYVRDKVVPVFGKEAQREILRALEEAKKEPVEQSGLAKL